MPKTKRPELHAYALGLIAISLGGTIYLSTRSTSLLMFKWGEALGVSSVLDALRAEMAPFKSNAPEWLLYSAPDGLWAMSFVCCTLGLFKYQMTVRRLAFALSAGLVGLISELAQLPFPEIGTFDFVDLAFYIAGTGLPFIIYYEKLQYTRIHNPR